MQITDIITTDFETFDSDTRASELEGTFRETGAKAVVIVEDDEYQGLVTQRQLANAHRDPDAKARGLVWHVAKVDVDDDVRTVARLMVGSRAKVLPVFEGDDLHGLITAEDLLEKIKSFLKVLTVEDVFTRDLISIAQDTSLGEVLHTLREHRVTYLPVIEDSDVVGIISLYDILGFSTREMRRTQGGSPSGEFSGGRSHGGFGERGGDLDRMLDTPVSDVMTESVVTTTVDTRLDEAVGTMLENDVSSLVVMAEGDPVGIVTKTDVLQALTWENEAQLSVQISGVDLLDDISRDEIAEMIEDTARKFGELHVLEANVFMHEHKEKIRGTPLLQARIRLFTDKGHFVGTGEGYGATHALHMARNVLERQILEGKDYGRTKKHPTEEELSKMLGWWLVGSPRAR